MVLTLTVLVLASCVKKNYEIPPIMEYSVTFETDTNYIMKTIDELKNYTGDWAGVDSNIVIKGTVVSSDKLGNFYKDLYIQDSTGGLDLRLDEYDLFTKYPVGQLIYIKCQELYLGTYNDVYQLGSEDGRIASSKVDIFIHKSDGGKPIIPKVKKINEVGVSDLGTLIKFENVQFADAELNKTYSDVVSSTTQNRNVQDCSSNTILLRTSGYADFGGDTIPSGQGSIVGVLGKFGTDYQLYIRDVSDVDMKDERCEK